MKKTFYILAAAIVAMVACTKEIEGPSAVEDDPAVVEQTPTVEFKFTATFPDTKMPTRGAMGDTPVIDNLYVAVFGQSSNALGGTLQHWTPAELIEAVDDSHTYKAEYKVILPLSDEGREIHFIANYPDDEPPTFDREREVLEKFNTADGNGAYWQRVSLPDGIKGYIDEETGEYKLDVETASKLSSVHLVRNYAKITVEEALPTAEFTIDSYTLINVPTKGTIAPENNNSFVTPYTQIEMYCDAAADSDLDFVAELDNVNYRGLMPSDAEIDTSDPGESSMVPPNSSKKPSGFYMYERPVPTQVNTQTAVIVKLTWKDADDEIWTTEGHTESPNKLLAGQTYYYKIEVIGASGEYVPIRRNIWYKIQLTGLEGDGEQTYSSAFSGPYFGNVSASIETATLNEITDNTSTITVSRMDYTTVSSGDKVDIYFQYHPVGGETITTEGTDVTTSIRTVDGYSQSISSKTTAINASWQGGTWGKITVTLKDVDTGGNMLRGILRIQGNRAGKRVLFRDIVFTVMPKANFVSTASDVTTNGDNVNVTIKLPPNLSYSVFPVQVKIEAQNKNLTTNDPNLPVGFGESMFTSGVNSFYFIRTIQYSDYYHKDATTGNWTYYTDYECQLKKTDNQAVNIKIADMEGYFNEKSLY